MSEGRPHRWRKIGTARKKWRRRKRATGRSKRRRWRAAGRSKRGSDPRAPGIGFSSFLLFVSFMCRHHLSFLLCISLVRSQCVLICRGRALPLRDGGQEQDKIVCRHTKKSIDPATTHSHHRFDAKRVVFLFAEPNVANFTSASFLPPFEMLRAPGASGSPVHCFPSTGLRTYGGRGSFRRRL